MTRIRHTHYYADARTDIERLNEPASQLTIFDGRIQLAPCLGILAPTYSGDLDGERLTSQLDAVLALMSDHAWRSLAEIRAAIGRGSEAGLSARLREIRHSRRGVVERRRRGDPKAGLWEYRLLK